MRAASPHPSPPVPPAQRRLLLNPRASPRGPAAASAQSLRLPEAPTGPRQASVEPRAPKPLPTAGPAPAAVAVREVFRPRPLLIKKLGG